VRSLQSWSFLGDKFPPPSFDRERSDDEQEKGEKGEGDEESKVSVVSLVRRI